MNRCTICGSDINPDSGLNQIDEPQGGLCPECYLMMEDMGYDPEDSPELIAAFG